jgi:hypothetical protein
MNTRTSRLRSSAALVACAALLPLFAACNKQERVEAQDKAKDAYAATADKAKDMYASTSAALSESWSKVKAYSYEKRDEFTSTSKALQAQMDAQVSKLQATVAKEQASASRKAAMEELKNADADYKQKLAALSSATAATWDSAKASVISSWDKLEASYRKALAEK